MLFGDIITEGIHINPLGQIAQECWQEIPAHFPDVEVEPFRIMPNYIHGLIIILENPGRGTISCMRRHDSAPTTTGEKFGHPVFSSIPTIIRAYKSAVSRHAGRELAITHVWQRNYYDHIIRSEEEYIEIWDYVDTNSQNWEEDQLQP